jgi:hypothetical protein
MHPNPCCRERPKRLELLLISCLAYISALICVSDPGSLTLCTALRLVPGTAVPRPVLHHTAVCSLALHDITL